MKHPTLHYLLFFSLLMVLITMAVTSTTLLKYGPTKKCTLTFDNGVTLYDVPLAETEIQRQKGLSGNNTVASGMLFSLPEPGIVAFWMKDTKIPLDIGFISADRILLKIEAMQPETSTYHFSEEAVSYALELPHGQFAKFGLQVGSQITYQKCQ